MRYYPDIVKLFYKDCGLPIPEFEVKFHPTRKWRLDIAFTEYKLAIEVQGGIWNFGRHSRGKGMRNDMEKNNEAIRLGWKVLYVEPKDVCMVETVNLIRDCMHDNQKSSNQDID